MACCSECYGTVIWLCRTGTRFQMYLMFCSVTRQNLSQLPSEASGIGKFVLIYPRLFFNGTLIESWDRCKNCGGSELLSFDKLHIRTSQISVGSLLVWSCCGVHPALARPHWRCGNCGHLPDMLIHGGAQSANDPSLFILESCDC